MTEPAGLVRLQSWLSPSFPTGGFAWSAGLEQAVRSGWVADMAGLREWLESYARHATLWNDCVLLACVARDGAGIAEKANALALAMCGAPQRLAETTAQGRAFADAASAWPGNTFPDGMLVLPVAVGIACHASAIGARDAVAAFANAQIAAQLQAAIRLGVTGQAGAAQSLAALEPVVLEIAARASDASLDDVGGCAMLAEIASLSHETLQPRLFQS